jgi:hypothetical protein
MLDKAVVVLNFSQPRSRFLLERGALVGQGGRSRRL